MSGKRKLPSASSVPVSFSPFTSALAVIPAAKRARTSPVVKRGATSPVGKNAAGQRRLREKSSPKVPTVNSNAYSELLPALGSACSCYDTLRVGKRATQMVVRRAFRLRAFATHLHNGGSDKAFEAVLEAYEVLAGARASYDAKLASDGSKDGTSWSDRQPGTRASAVKPGASIGNDADEPEEIQSARKTSMQTWLKTYVGRGDVDLEFLTLLQLTILHENFCYQLQVDVPTGESEQLSASKASKAKKDAKVSFIAYTTAMGGGYRLQVLMGRLTLMTPPVACLERAIDWLEALLNMKATAAKRMQLNAAPARSKGSGEPLSEEEFLQALQEQPTMQLTFRVGMSSTCQRKQSQSGTTRDLELALNWWRQGTFTNDSLFRNAKGKGAKIRAKGVLDAQSSKHHQAEHAFKVLEEVRKNMMSRAITADRTEQALAKHERSRTLARLDEMTADRRDKVQTAAKQQGQERPSALKVPAKRPAPQAITSRPGSRPTPPPPSPLLMPKEPRQSIVGPSIKALATQALPPSGGGGPGDALGLVLGSSLVSVRPPVPAFEAEAVQRPSALKAPALKPRLPAPERTTTPPPSPPTPAPAPKAPGIQEAIHQEAIEKAAFQSADHVLLPGLIVKPQDVGCLLGWLSFDDLYTLRAASRGMHINREMELMNRLRVFYYDVELHGFKAKPQYSSRGRVVRPVNPIPEIATRLANFLRHFSRYIKELHLETAPCTLLENNTLLETLSEVSVTLATFPADGWSSNMDRKRVGQALKAGTLHKFLDAQGHAALK